MDFAQAIANQIAGFEKSKAQGSSDFDAWDQAAVDYLAALAQKLDQGVQPSEIYQQLQRDLPTLKEQVEKEEALPTFDWYDDHHHLKIASGRLQACKKAIALFEADFAK